ncbi:MAG TPA: hypothetical protein VFG00_12585 [Acidothermaceae bacterium]|nr:hypothetical protein [Acidothermaceae bacterium]
MGDQARALTAAAERLDRSVPAADEVGNEVLIDDRRIMRLSGPLFVLFSILLVPWTIFVALVLPSRQLSPNYDVAWAGFDVFLCAGLGATGYFALRRSRWAPLAAVATATMLVIDAWFDVMTSPSGRDLVVAVALAALVEIPLSALCMFLARRGQLVGDQRLEMVLPGSRGGSRHSRSSWATP